jgi:hypothetical protein
MWLGTLLLGLLFARLFVALNTPLPWMLGPLLSVAIGRMAGLPLAVPSPTRPLGQWIIGIALGLYFTPQVAVELGKLLPLIVFAALAALAFGTLGGKLLAKLSNADGASSYFAAMPGGASEMANLAERHGARSDLVAAAHSARVMLVVVLIPLLYVLLDLHGSDLSSLATPEFDPLRLAVLALLGAGGALLWARMGLVNAWIIGPLLVVGAIGASGQTLSSLPAQISALGQLCIGCSLGCRFSPQFLREAPRFLLSSLLVTLWLLLGGAGLAFVLAWIGDLNPASVILGLAPGGVAEMCITAKVLQLGVPLVTAFHVVRVLVVVVGAGPWFAWLSRRGAFQ